MPTFADKIWILGALCSVALLVCLFYYAKQARNKQMAKFVSSRLLEGLLQSYSPTKHTVKNTLIALGVFFVAIALARPQLGYEWNEIKSKGIDILFVLDSSKSMLAEDIKPNRLKRAKFAILDFIDELDGDRVGLVAFAGTAFLQCPLTLDYDAFRQSLDAVDTDIIPTGGTDISAAINEAASTFSDDNNYKIIVMVTDGEDLEESGIKRAKKAASNDITIYTVGVGTPNGSIIPIGKNRGNTEYLRDEEGNIVKTKLDETTLRQIAEATQGFYAPLGSTGEGLRQIYEYGLNSIPRQDLASTIQRVETERFQWPLGFAILLLMIEIFISKRKSTTSPVQKAMPAMKVAMLIIGVGLLFSLTPLMAKSGEALFEERDYQGAADYFQEALDEAPTDPRILYNLALSKHHLGKFEEAIAHWELSLLENENIEQKRDTFYNMGNAQYRLGQKALEAVTYDEAFLTAFPSNVSATQEAIELGKPALTAEPQIRQQAWQQCEAVQKKVQEDLTTAEKITTDLEPALKHWEKALERYQSALDLSPEDEDITFNQEFVEKKLTDTQTRKEDLVLSIEEQKKLNEELSALITALKAPTQIVLDAKAYAEYLIKQGRYVPAHSILSQTAQQDPTAEVYQDKQQRLQQIVGILDPEEQKRQSEAPLPPPPPVQK